MTDLASPVPPPAVGARSPGTSRAVYGMPMFATFLVADLDATLSWYVDGLGFLELFTVPGPRGPAVVHLRRWQFQDVLVRPATGPVAAGSGSVIGLAAVHDEIDPLAERARRHGGGRVLDVADTPWNTRDLTTVDPDGHVVVFTAARPPHLTDPAFTGDMRRWSAGDRR